jgi:hypothetical protein
MKKQGWKSESERHQLASRGIKTAENKVIARNKSINDNKRKTLFDLNEECVMYAVGYANSTQLADMILQAREVSDNIDDPEWTEDDVWDLIDIMDNRWGGIRKEVEKKVEEKRYFNNQS